MADGKRKSGTASKSSAKKPGKAGPAGPEEPRTWKQRLLTVAKWGSIVGLVMALVMSGLFYIAYRSIDIPNPNADFLTETTHVYYSDGKTTLGDFAVQKRDVIDYADMPDTIKDAVVAAEDQSFWSNSGLDPRGILRAAFSNASGNLTQGASTITQQYVKILYLSQERTWKRKVKEAILSLKIKNQLSKQEILEGYLNTIYFGRGAYGIQAAAQAYFKVDAKDLDLQQSAVLAAILNDPNNLDPANSKAAKAELKGRYQYVINAMADMDTITGAQQNRAYKKLPEFPEFKTEDSYGQQRGHVLTMVKKELLRLGFSEQEINGGGLKVTTTFTKKAMDAAKDGMEEARPDGYSYKNLHVAVATVEPGTGAVRGIYAGQDYLLSQLNWAVEGGQAGSTFKPFALAAGIKDGFSLKDTFDGNSPYEFPDGSDVINEFDTDYGRVNMIKATEDSINTAYIDLTESMEDGPQKVIDAAVSMGIPPAEPARPAFGFPDFTDGLQAIPGVTLGFQTVSPINMANAYATVANGGVAAEPFIIEKVVDQNDDVRYDHKVQDHRALPEDIASDVSYAMQEVVKAGTAAGSLSGFAWPAAGKTGTATNGRGEVSSAWFAGYTAQLATAVMYVRGDGTEQLKGWLPEYFGGAYPARTWRAVMERDMAGLDPVEFPEPAYVDGDAPDDGHEPFTPKPSPTKTKETETPETETTTPTEEPTTETPTTEIPTTPTDTPTPTDNDTDGDGLTDGQEIIRRTDPNNPDTDGDCILDGADDNPLNPDVPVEGGTCQPAEGESRGHGRAATGHDRQLARRRTRRG
ncbi:penicillin-binding protein [Nocardioides humilatus]|uniref:Penicillin-binding protein n=1 Tax=Nocardioides humilatus TaxID=2607660 RepID=A0A5B1L4I0_9ACTN|nr:transglycosylase domain-containing protein [Nocardioides humilatus]KAA1415415.1 penicillin-binding protein [Nocardioides humilatus]